MSSTTTDLLSRRFGSETINYYAGSRLNRYSFLRSDSRFLASAIAAQSARFVVLDSLAPLVVDRRSLAFLSAEQVRPLIGDDGFSASAPLVIFLGLAESEEDAVEMETSEHGIVRGRPYFAVDATPRPPVSEAARALLDSQAAQGISVLSDPRSMTFSPEAASIFAQARSMIDWNTRNPFCAGCGRPTVSIQAGYKRACPRTDAGACPTQGAVSNVCFPRSDPTMIAAVVSADGNRILLGRQSRYPPQWYSCLAGFIEPGESMEEAVRREVWEEAGVKVGRVVIHSTQPWPYPASLMLGAIAQALPDCEDIVLNDKELESASWFNVDEVRDALNAHKPGEEENKGKKGLRVPPPQAIANRLMTAVVQGFLTGIPKI
ncbi:hypothetical protein CDD80_2597 [Ophiocordyceps camponoti-rufipedis]|uniref:NAD(+) diphosphatase n=1 Tax=Ophiocordyceps camponoti-rufipedis TaxID=2004952 RepID=A0A2C5Z2A4_9HYPO|nr:hypothetical protein CDD80_2597 [Ophiocordyceps camponoti-rufipedis]